MRRENQIEKRSNEIDNNEWREENIKANKPTRVNSIYINSSINVNKFKKHTHSDWIILFVAGSIVQFIVFALEKRNILDWIE